ncbi:helicase [Agyrium rufum]|nr:helicase [Agyrium rufum]
MAAINLIALAIYGLDQNVNPAAELASDATHVALAFLLLTDFTLTEQLTSWPLLTTVDQMRRKFPKDSKVLISIGGWADDIGWRIAVATDTSQRLSARNVGAMVKDTGSDGVDIDWEYPGGNGEDYKQESQIDLAREIDAYPKLLAEIRAVFGSNMLMSAAVPGLRRDMMAFKKITVSLIMQSLDFLNVSTMNLGLAFYVKWFKTAPGAGADVNPLGLRTILMEDPVTEVDLGQAGAFSWHDQVPDEVQELFAKALNLPSLSTMLNIPFKQPVKKHIISATSDFPVPNAKRRRLSDDEDDKAQTTTHSASRSQTHPRQPLNTASDHNSPAQVTKAPSDGQEGHYRVLWRKFTAKKHKTWDDDGILSVIGGYAYLKDASGKGMGRAACTTPLLPGSTLSVAGRDVEIDSVIPVKEYRDLKRGAPDAATEVEEVQKIKALPNAKLPLPKPQKKAAEPTAKYRGPVAKNIHEDADDDRTINREIARSAASNSRFKNPTSGLTLVSKVDDSVPTPRHDPNTADALVMKRPLTAPKGKKIVDVVVDPLLTKHLRAHQKEGVKFLYECVMGLRDYGGEGAILADEMGLGKTLQTIALIWMLLKQNPIHEEKPVVKKAVIVCPATLVNNWRKEFKKWLGNERIGVFHIEEGSRKRISDFTKGKSYSVMVVGYEKFNKIHEQLKEGSGIDILIADEGHRLKSAQNKSLKAINSMPTMRRIILSGTPIQNNLGEFFTMVDLVNPGVLGTVAKFTKDYDTAIVASRQPNATAEVKEIGEEKSQDLAELTRPFILRRTADILSDYLPSKTEYMLLCRPTSGQASLYKQVLTSPVFQSALGNSESALQLITILRKVCNSPKLLVTPNTKDPDKVPSAFMESLLSTLPTRKLHDGSNSAKIQVLDELLHKIHTDTSDKVVIVSHFTSTLDILGNLLSSLSLPFLRLDGSTPTAKRQSLVDEFNRTSQTQVFAFLLSAKAGGVGINLIGASRLVLFDVDWNPSTDAQAMARIHRDGQKKPCVIYRFLLAGGLDEKIWQRQVTKLGLASSVMDQKANASSFSREELRDLFRLDEGESCQTHDLIGCNCGGSGALPDVTLAAAVEYLSDDNGPDRDVDGEAPEQEDLPELDDLISTSKSTPKLLTLDPTSSDVSGKRARDKRRRRMRRTISDDEDEDIPTPSSDEEENHPLLPGLVKASQLDVETQERAIHEAAAAKQGGSRDNDLTKMQSLVAYSHIDTSRFATDANLDREDTIRDEVLLRVLKDEGNRVGFVFAKRSG